jgi:hypothetical protein
MSCVEHQREDKQPLVKPSTVVAAGLAAALAAFFTSRFGVAGTVLGTALTAMIITAGSALFGFYLERAVAKARSSVPGVVRVRPPRGRSVLLGGLLAAVASFVVGIGTVTGVELSAGKSLSCWVWDECPTNDDGGGRGAASRGTTGTRPSILGGGQRTVAPTPQPGGVEDLRRSAAPREQEVTHSPHVPQGRPGRVKSEPRESPQENPAAPAQDGAPEQAPGGGRQTAQERTVATPSDGQAPKEEQPSTAPPRDPAQPSPSDNPPADRRPPSEQSVRPSP